MPLNNPEIDHSPCTPCHGQQRHPSIVEKGERLLDSTARSALLLYQAGRGLLSRPQGFLLDLQFTASSPPWHGKIDEGSAA